LLVFENGKEIFRMSPAGNENATEKNHAGSERKPSDASGELGSAVQRASSEEPEKASEASLASTEDGLVHRVEPQYPEQARQQGIQGAVVLEVQIGGEGAVQDVHVISGPPELAQASIDAVKQWRFNPRLVNGNAVPMQTRVTLNFRLP
jgi:protein TonB